MRERLTRYPIYLLAALFIACLAAYPLLAHAGLLNTRGGGDSPFLLQRLQQLETAVLDGHFPVRWMPDANYGYGYPFYNFYAPLSIYITAVFRLIGFSYMGSIQLSQLAGFVVAAWGMYQLGRRWWGNAAAGFISAAAYTLAPFHLVNVYVRGDSLAEFWAMAFYPLVILTADNLMQSDANPARAVRHFALAYAALILSHNISALIFTPFLGLFILLRWLHLRRSRTTHHAPLATPLAGLFFALLLAFALAAWFFIPALAEQSLAQLGPVTEGYFHYSNHFRGADLVQGSFFFDYNPDGGRAFRMGLVQAITAVFALIALIIFYRRLVPQLPRSPVPLLLTVLIATVMITPLSRPLWDHLPLLPFTQFPWRFLSVQAFGIALLLGVLALLPWGRWLVAVAAVMLLISALGRLATDHLTISDSDVTAERLAQYEWFTGNIGTTISAEYLPPTVQPRPVTSAWLLRGERWPVTALTGQPVTAVLTEQRTTRQTWQIETAESTPLIFPTLYWPGWQAQVDGQDSVVQVAPGSGLIMLTVPPGPHNVELRLARSPVRLIAEWLSLLALLVIIWLSRSDRFIKPVRSHVYIVAALVALAIVVRLWPERPLPADNLTWDFAQMGYLQHGAVTFDNGGTLLSYSYSGDTAVPDQPFTISLEWQGTEAEATVSLYTPAVHRVAAAAALAQQTQRLQPGANNMTLALPADVPAGLVVPQLLIADGRPLLPSGRTRGDLFLRPLRIVAPAAVVADGRLDVRATEVQTADQAVQTQLAWFTPQPLSQNLNLSLRLLDGDGLEVAQLDTQPGYGFVPSSSWLPGQWVNDWLNLPLPADVSPAGGTLVLRLYDVADQSVLLTRRLGDFDSVGVFRANEPSFVLPEGIVEVTAVFSDTIQLRGYEVGEPTADGLPLTLYWQALGEGQRDYTRFVHLLDPAQPGPPVSQADGAPRQNSYPPSQWTAAEIITDTVLLPLVAVPPGDYEVVVGFYEPTGDLPRLPAVDGDGRSLPNDAFPLPEPIHLP